MPQLDLVILFSQIFWLAFSFILLYIVVLYYFLPLFLKSIKSRILLLEYNVSKANYFQNSFSERSELLKKLVYNSLQSVKNTTLTMLSKPSNVEFVSIQQAMDKLVGRALWNIVLYCNLNLLKNINFRPRIYSYSNNKK